MTRDGDPNRVASFGNLIELIENQVTPSTWDEVGGPATIDSYAVNGCRLVIGQTWEGHLRIAELLADLRTTPAQSAAEAKIRQALQATTELEFVETPLQDVIDYLAARHGIGIQIDRRALKDAGSAAITPITLKTHNGQLRDALWLILEPLNLDYVVKDEMLLITTRQKAEELVAKLFPSENYQVLQLPKGRAVAAKAAPPARLPRNRPRPPSRPMRDRPSKPAVADTAGAGGCFSRRRTAWPLDDRSLD